MRPEAGNGAFAAAFERLALQVLERGWLSSNNVVFAEWPGAPGTVVDSGYVGHAAQTLALVHRVLPAGPRRVVNTHLHSDHCGGNAALQAADGVDETLVPAPRLDAVRCWDVDALGYDAIDQRCDRFDATGGLADGQVLALGTAAWQVHAAPGHDPDAVMLFEPAERVLIAGDALWESRVAILFPELVGEPGVGPARAALNRIEALAPRIVIPGHGAPFTGVADALAASRRRLDAFEADPVAHLRYALRALTVFHLFEHRRRPRAALLAWMTGTPLLRALAARLPDGLDAEGFAVDNLDRLLRDGTLRAEGGDVTVP